MQALIPSQLPEMTVAEYVAWRRRPAIRSLKLRLFDKMNDGTRILGTRQGKPFYDTGLPESSFCFVTITA